jgi:hypothetical protein
VEVKEGTAEGEEEEVEGAADILMISNLCSSVSDCPHNDVIRV